AGTCSHTFRKLKRGHGGLSHPTLPPRKGRFLCRKRAAACVSALTSVADNRGCQLRKSRPFHALRHWRRLRWCRPQLQAEYTDGGCHEGHERVSVVAAFKLR